MVDTDAPSRLLLLDGHSLAYRAFYALKDANIVTTTGQHTEGCLRLHVDADQRATRRAADPRRGGVRRFPQDVPHRDVRRVQGQPDVVASRVLRPGRSGQGGAGRAAHPVGSRRTAYEADDVIATLARGRRPRVSTCFICTGDRDAYQLVDDHVTVLYPRQRRIRPRPHDAGGGAGEVRPDSGAVPRLRGAAWRPVGQPAEHSRRG